MSFTAKILKQRGQSTERMYYLDLDIEGRMAFYFVLIEPAKEKSFLEDIENNVLPFRLNDYMEEVVESGWGEPSEQLKQRMRDRYGIVFDDDAE